MEEHGAVNTTFIKVNTGTGERKTQGVSEEVNNESNARKLGQEGQWSSRLVREGCEWKPNR